MVPSQEFLGLRVTRIHFEGGFEIETGSALISDGRLDTACPDQERGILHAGPECLRKGLFGFP